MSHARHGHSRNYTKPAIVAIATLTLAGIIVATVMAIISHRGSGRVSAQTLINSIAAYEEISLAEEAAQQQVIGAAKCLDDRGNFLCYRVIGYGEGFNDRVSVACYFTENGKTLIGIAVVEQSETKGYGAEVADSPFVQRFEYSNLPVYLYDGSVPESEMPKQDGTRVDALSGATVSSYAVVEAVNHAYTYLREQIL